MSKRDRVSYASIRNILTLRYDPAKPTNASKLRFNDFERIEYRGSFPDRIESMLKDEIKLSVRNAKNVAVPIGSGVDSAVIMALAREVFPEKNIFGISLGFQGDQDETGSAKRICEKLNTDCHIVHVDNPLHELPMQIKIVREQRWNLWYYYVLEKAKELGSNIMLTGDGGDELFAGYVFRYSKYLDTIDSNLQLPDSVPRSAARWAKRAWAYLQCHDRDWVPDQASMFGPRIAKLFDWFSILKYFRTYFDKAASDNDLSQVFLADYNGKLIYDWIPTNSSLSRHFRIPISSPFLSKPITRFAPHIPIDHKYDAETRQGKLILRKILENRGILELISKKKLGFGMDLVSLWDRHGARLAGEYLEDAVVVKERLISASWLDRTLSMLKRNKDPRYINKVMQLLSLEIWYRIFITKEMPHGTKL